MHTDPRVGRVCRENFVRDISLKSTSLQAHGMHVHMLGPATQWVTRLIKRVTCGGPLAGSAVFTCVTNSQRVSKCNTVAKNLDPVAFKLSCPALTHYRSCLV